MNTLKTLVFRAGAFCAPVRANVAPQLTQETYPRRSLAMELNGRQETELLIGLLLQ